MVLRPCIDWCSIGNRCLIRDWCTVGNRSLVRHWDLVGNWCNGLVSVLDHDRNRCLVVTPVVIGSLVSVVLFQRLGDVWVPVAAVVTLLGVFVVAVRAVVVEFVAALVAVVGVFIGVGGVGWAFVVVALDVVVCVCLLE